MKGGETEGHTERRGERWRDTQGEGGRDRSRQTEREQAETRVDSKGKTRQRQTVRKCNTETGSKEGETDTKSEGVRDRHRK